MDEAIDSKQGEEELSIMRKKVGTVNYGNAKISINCGCTANVVIVTPKKIICANIGDSRSVLCRRGNAHPLSFDHKPEN